MRGFCIFFLNQDGALLSECFDNVHFQICVNVYGGLILCDVLRRLHPFCVT